MFCPAHACRQQGLVGVEEGDERKLASGPVAVKPPHVSKMLSSVFLCSWSSLLKVDVPKALISVSCDADSRCHTQPIFPFCRWVNWGSQRLSNLLELILQRSALPGTQGKAFPLRLSPPSGTLASLPYQSCPSLYPVILWTLWHQITGLSLRSRKLWARRTSPRSRTEWVAYRTAWASSGREEWYVPGPLPAQVPTRFLLFGGLRQWLLVSPKNKTKKSLPSEQKGSVAYCRNLENTEKY